MNSIGFYIMPAVLTITILWAIFKKISVFDLFLQGAKEGFNTTITLIPTFVGLITAITMLKASGALDIFSNFLSPIFLKLNIPPEIAPLTLMKPISGSGSIAILDNIFKSYGPDSFVGLVASAIMGSTETTFYTIAVYFGATKVKHTRHTLICALLTDLTAIVVAICLIKLTSNNL